MTNFSARTEARIERLYRYPVKGFSPERLQRVSLKPGETFPADRKYAVENGPSGFDPADPQYFPKIRFLMLMRHEKLAALETSYDDANGMMTIRHAGSEVARGDLGTQEGRTAIETFLTSYSQEFAAGPFRVLNAPGHSFSDVAKKVVSILNLASIESLAGVVGRPIDPLRFRANVYVSGWPAWHEFDLLGARLSVGSVTLKVVKRIQRCAAVNVDPVTAARDMNLPASLQREFQHADCGVYAEVIKGGDIAEGDAIALTEPALI